MSKASTSRRDLGSRNVSAEDWLRQDHNPYDKTIHHFTLIGQELHNIIVLLKSGDEGSH